MKYVYVLQSVGLGDHFYIGVTDNLRDRLRRHNAGEVSHTAKHLPWKLNTYIAFSDEARAYYDLDNLWGDAKRIEVPGA